MREETANCSEAPPAYLSLRAPCWCITSHIDFVYVCVVKSRIVAFLQPTTIYRDSHSKDFNQIYLLFISVVCWKCVGVPILHVLKDFGAVCFPARRTASSHRSVNGQPVRQHACQVFTFLLLSLRESMAVINLVEKSQRALKSPQKLRFLQNYSVFFFFSFYLP